MLFFSNFTRSKHSRQVHSRFCLFVDQIIWKQSGVWINIQSYYLIIVIHYPESALFRKSLTEYYNSY